MRRVKTLTVTLLAGAAFPVLAEPARAQDNTPAAPAAADELGAGEIIITATKRSERLQNVPMSVTALGGQLLEQRQVASFDDYAKLLPSLSYSSFGPGQAQLYFRGIATGGDGLVAGPLPGSGLYIDEVPVTSIFSSVDLHAYDLARVEALAGPQGTLYGASSLSGTLRLITNKPDPSGFAAGYDVEANKFGEGDFGGKVEGFANLPINENMAIRLVGYYQHDGGYIDNTPGTRTYQRPHTVDDGQGGTTVVNAPMTVNNFDLVENDYNDVDSYGGRAALRIDLDESWTVTPHIIYQHVESNGQFLFDPRAGDLENHDFVDSHSLDKWYLASLTVQGKISDWDLTASASYMHRKLDVVQDYSYFTVAYDTYPDYNYLIDVNGNDIDPTQGTRGFDRYKKYAGELRISSPAGNRWRVTLGAFAQRQIDDRIAEYITEGVSNAVNPFSPPVPGGAGPDDVFFTDVHRVDRDYALFGEFSFDITPALTLTAGIRGFKANNTLEGFSGGFSALQREIDVFGCTGTTAQECPNIDKKFVESGETHKVNLSWKVDRDRMVYLTYSTGFRPGGNNRDVFALDQLQIIPPFKSDTLTNYEFGWKTQWLSRRLRFNGAIFWEKWSDIQYSLPGILGIFYTVNAGTARSRGIEGDVSWNVDDHLTLTAGGTYVDAELTEPFCDQVNGCDSANGGSIFAPKGTRLPITPKFKISATARYEFDLGATRAYLQGSVNHQSGTRSYLTTEGAAVIGPTEGFTTFDFSGGLEWRRFTLEAFIQNAFDKRGILSKNFTCAPSLCGPYARLYPVKPMVFGIRFGQTF